MSKRAPQQVYSKDTMCLRCHNIVIMVHEAGVDEVAGGWQCPTCGHVYLFRFWKIKKGVQPKPKRPNELIWAIVKIYKRILQSR